MADFSEVIARENGNVSAYFSRASALDALGDFEAAVEDYSTALQLDPASASTHARCTPILPAFPLMLPT